MTQEHIMKKRMIRAIILSVITSVALAVFIGLYIDATRRVQETYREQFNANLAHTIQAIDAYNSAEGDFELRYRRIVSEMSSANSFAFLLDNLTENQKVSINELNACLLKYPQQMQDTGNLEALRQSLDDMQNNLDKGFEEAENLVSGIDKKGY